jgi:hypothetical protein
VLEIEGQQEVVTEGLETMGYAKGHAIGLAKPFAFAAGVTLDA